MMDERYKQKAEQVLTDWYENSHSDLGLVRIFAAYEATIDACANEKDKTIAALEAQAAQLAGALEKAKVRLLEMQAMLGWDMALPVEKRKILPDYIAGEIDTALAAYKAQQGE